MEIPISDAGLPKNLVSEILRTPGARFLWSAVLVFVVTSVSAAGNSALNSGSVPANLIQSLPAGSTPRSLAVDGDGNLLIAGKVAPPGSDLDAIDVFVAKLSSNGALTYLKTIGGASFDIATSIAVDKAGNAYVTGYTNSHDFPTTAGAWQTVYRSTGNAAFAVKLSASGDIVYSTLMGDATEAVGWGIAVNAAGEAFVTGDVSGDFPVTPGVIEPPATPRSFIVRLSKAGDQAIFSAKGPGGRKIALDAQDNVYIAGTAFYQGEVPITPNAFQTHAGDGICGGGGTLLLPCTHQYVCKIDSTASRLFFCTYITGWSGERPAGIAVDRDGNVFLAGTTLSADYPVTPDAFQAANHSARPPDPLDQLDYRYWFFPETGYFTKLSADGTRLLYSTYLGGSLPDLPSAIALDDTGEVFIAATAQSADFPALPSAPTDCLPKRLRGMPVVVRLNAADFSVGSTTVVEGAPYCEDCGPLLAIGPRGILEVVRSGPFRARVTTEASDPPDPIACITDSADFAQIGPVAPGQLVSIFGNSVGSPTAISYDPSLPSLPTALGGVSVLIDGEAAPLLYVAPDQINFAIPSGVADRSALTIELTTLAGTSAKRTVAVVPASPALFTNGVTDYPLCQSKTLLNSVSALVFNQDGTVNSCDNPAAPGSVFQVFVNGAGQGVPTAAADNIPSTLPLAIEAVESVSGPAGLNLWRAAGRVPVNARGYAALSLLINGVNTRERKVAIWVEP